MTDNQQFMARLREVNPAVLDEFAARKLVEAIRHKGSCSQPELLQLAQTYIKVLNFCYSRRLKLGIDRWAGPTYPDEAWGCVIAGFVNGIMTVDLAAPFTLDNLLLKAIQNNQNFTDAKGRKERKQQALARRIEDYTLLYPITTEALDGALFASTINTIASAKLKARDTELLLMKFVEGYTDAEIAVKLNTTAATIHRACARALDKLKSFHRKQEQTDELRATKQRRTPHPQANHHQREAGKALRTGEV